MKREVVAPLAFRQYESGRTIEPLIAKGKLDDWCLALCMLATRVIARLDVTDQDRSHVLSFRLDRRVRRGPPRLRRAGDRLDVGVTQRQLDHWIRFFLRYRALGKADVDHIDVEVLDSQTGPDHVIAIILKVDHVRPAMKWERFIRILGLTPGQAAALQEPEAQEEGGSSPGSPS